MEGFFFFQLIRRNDKLACSLRKKKLNFFLQLIRRNDELALLYEKIKIQQSTLNKGEVQVRP